jgi:hypothetical protein
VPRPAIPPARTLLRQAVELDPVLAAAAREDADLVGVV